MPKLSLIVPVYNVEPFVRRCLDSITPREDVEIIIVDDGSTDESGKICDEYKDQFVIVHKTNGGCCDARNTGIEKAKGDFIAHLDADDELIEGAIDRMISLIDRFETCDIIQFDFCKHQNGEDKKVNSCRNLYYPLEALPSWWVLVWNKLYKREFIEKNNLRFLKGMRYDDDAHYNLQCFRYLPRIYGSSEVLVRHHYDNEGSITHTLNKEKFIGATIATAELLREDNPPIVERLIRERIVFKWTSKQYIKAFGGEK